MFIYLKYVTELSHSPFWGDPPGEMDRCPGLRVVAKNPHGDFFTGYGITQSKASCWGVAGIGNSGDYTPPGEKNTELVIGFNRFMLVLL